jgi:hypothetical protein
MPSLCGSCRRHRVNAAFAVALEAFTHNMVLWQMGATTEQGDTLRSFCLGNRVAFDPRHYRRLSTGDTAGWIGGPEYATPPAGGGTAFVAVRLDGPAYGMGGTPISPTVMTRGQRLRAPSGAK